MCVYEDGSVDKVRPVMCKFPGLGLSYVLSDKIKKEESIERKPFYLT